MIAIYDLIIYEPLLNALVFLYDTVAFNDLGLAIIFLTVFIRLALFPLFHKGIRHQMVMQELQPKIKKIQEDHKDNKEKQMEATMSLYKDHRVNPFSGMLIMFVQLPVLIALYQIFLHAFDPEFLNSLYSFIPNPGTINNSFLGLINLGEKNILIVGFAALAQYFQGRLALPRTSGGPQTQAEKIGRKMVFLGPIITVIIFYNFPAAVALYWAASSTFSVFQQITANKIRAEERLAAEARK